MQNVSQESSANNPKIDKVNVVVHHDIGNLSSSNPHSSPAKSETETYSEHRRYMSDSSESEEDSVSEVEPFMIDQEFEEDTQVVAAKFLLNPDEDRAVDPETQARLEALLQAAGISQLAAKDGKHLADPEVLRRLTSSVSCALDEAAAALTRMRSDNPRTTTTTTTTTTTGTTTTQQPQQQPQQQQQQLEKTSLVEACTDGDVGTVRKLLTEGRSVHETSEEGESLLSLACSAGYYELAQVLLAMHANVEDRGIKGECTPLMEAASSGHLEIVKLLVKHGADVNAQSTSGNTPLMYGCAGGHTEVVRFLLENGANVEDHNENGHTPLMEAASAGYVSLASILLNHGAGINTHSNEFKESALTLACYKGHLDMVRFLLEAGADQEHKTDEMHTALMEASMDGHVEVARLLLDSGAQVNMPTDSFESPLTLAACGGHVDLALLLIERGANIEEVNDEGYTPLMEAAREGHEEMVHLLLDQGANINSQTDETQETALTLACCGGFTEVTDILLKNGADIELGASTPLMEASQEGHLDLVKFLLENGANVHAQTQTGDTALSYACENGHTDVADYLLKYGANLEHESEGGRTPLMKACRAGHLCTVQFLISQGANVLRQTSNNDHTPLSLACAGGHLSVVELLLSHNADPRHKLKDNSTMLIEAAKGGHTSVVQLLLDYPHSMQPIIINQQQPEHESTTATNLSMLPGQIGSRDSPLLPSGASTTNLLAPSVVTSETTMPPSLSPQPLTFFQPTTAGVLQEVPEAMRIISQEDNILNNPSIDVNKQQILSSTTTVTNRLVDGQQNKTTFRKLCAKNCSISNIIDSNLTSAEAQQVRTQPLQLSDFDDDTIDFINKKGPNNTLVEFVKNRKKQYNIVSSNGSTITSPTDEGTTEKQQILEELHRVERELHGKTHSHVFQCAIPQDQCPTANNTLPHLLNIDIAMQQQRQQQQQQQGLGTGLPGSLFPTNNLQVHNTFYTGIGGGVGNVGGGMTTSTGTAAGTVASSSTTCLQSQPAFYFTPLPTSVALTTATNAATATTPQPIKFQSVSSHTEVSQNTAISDRPKAKAVSKKEGKNLRKLQQQTQHQFQPNLFGQPPTQIFSPIPLQQQQQQQQIQQQQQLQQIDNKPLNIQDATSIQNLVIDEIIEQEALAVKHDTDENILTASILQQIQNSSIHAFVRSPQEQKTRLELYDHLQEDKVSKLDITEKDFSSVEDVVQTLESFNDSNEINEQTLNQHNLQVQPYPSSFEESMIATFTTNNQQELSTQTDLSHVEYFALPTNGASASGNGTGTAQLPVRKMYKYEHYLNTTGMPNKEQSGAIYQAGFQAGINLMQQQLACPAVNTSETITTATVVPTNVVVAGTSTQQYITPQQQQQQQVVCTPPVQAPCNHVINTTPIQQSGHHCPVPCTQHQQLAQTHHLQQKQQQHVQQQLQTTTNKQHTEGKKFSKASQEGVKVKKGRVRHQNQQGNNVQANQKCQADSNNEATQCDGTNPECPNNETITSCLDVDSETESNHDTALTLACAGGHEDLVELLLTRGADIEHRDKKGFTPLILASTAGHEKVVEILLNHNADIEAQSERTKDTPLSLACSGGRYEVAEILLNRNANREHRNVSDYTPLSLAASGGYVNIIKLLLSHGAEINSRTGSKLGISPLMLAAMNGHTAAVKMLLDMGSDINAQIETNRNTALTLACFQGRHEVVSLLLDRKANVEHRAKTGLTPLMEAASGGYVEVGRVLLDKGADVNATPVPSSRDTALTIAADKGHVRFVELLLGRGAQVEVKNKKGNSPLWLAANGGHLAVIELLYNANADIDSQDNRKVSCLMAAFRKGHIKVVKWMVHHVNQFPSDLEMVRFGSTVAETELADKCDECIKIIRATKETEAAKANKFATILLEELDMEKSREQSKRLAAARRRERKKQKKFVKKEERRKLLQENKRNENYDDDKKSNNEEEKVEEEDNVEDVNIDPSIRNVDAGDKEEGDSGIDANSQGSCSSNDIKTNDKRKDKKKKKIIVSMKTTNKSSSDIKAGSSKSSHDSNDKRSDKSSDNKNANGNISSGGSKSLSIRKGLIFEATKSPAERDDFEATGNDTYVSNSVNSKSKKNHNYDNDNSSQSKGNHNSTSPKQSSKREDGWKEVVRKSSVQTVSTSSSESGVKKVSVPLNAISRVIGRGGSNINAIRGATGAHIEVEKQSKGQGERIITIKGSAEATKQAHSLIAILIKDPDVDILQVLPKTNKTTPSTTTLWDKTQIGTKKVAGKVLTTIQPTLTVSQIASIITPKIIQTIAPSIMSSTRAPSTTTVKLRGAIPVITTRVTAPRLVAQAEKNAAAAAASITSQSASTTATTMSCSTIIRSSIPQHSLPTSITPSSLSLSNSSIMTGRIPTKVITTTSTQTFAAKLTETTAATTTLPNHSIATTVATSATTSVITNKSRMLGLPTQQSQQHQQINVGPVSPQLIQHSTMNNSNIQSSPKHNHRPTPTASAPPTMQHYHQQQHHHQSPGKGSIFGAPTNQSNMSVPPVSETTTTSIINLGRSTTPNIIQTSAIQVNQQSQQDDLNTSLLQQQQQQTHSEYSLFYSTDQPMWRRDNELQKPSVNFAAVTGGGTNNNMNSNATTQGNMQQKFVDSEPPQIVDVSKAPGYRGNTVCSPVSSKTSSNGATPPNINNVVNNSTFQVYAEQSMAITTSTGGTTSKTQQQQQQQQLPPIGRLPSQLQSNNQNDMTSVSSNNHFYSEIFKTTGTGATTTNNIPHNSGNSLLNDAHLLQTTFNPSYPPQPTPQNNIPLVSMSRLNPKAPDFSSSVYNSMQTKQQQQPPPPQMYNGYPMPNQNTNQIYSANKNIVGNNNNTNSNNNDYNRSTLSTASQNRWTLMQMQQPFTQQQSELISGMATGMTLHSLARATGGEILENGADLGIVNRHSPTATTTMSPNLPPQPHNLHGGGGGGVNVVSSNNNNNSGVNDNNNHFIDDSRKQPQPIGTERGRKMFNPNLDSNCWMFSGGSNSGGGGVIVSNNDTKPTTGSRWPNTNTNDRFGGMPNVFADDIPQMLNSIQSHLPMDNSHNFSNGPTLSQYMIQQQQPPIGNVRPYDYIPVDALKMDFPWDATRPNMSDIQEKPHGWTGMSNKWNQ